MEKIVIGPRKHHKYNDIGKLVFAGGVVLAVLGTMATGWGGYVNGFNNGADHGREFTVAEINRLIEEEQSTKEEEAE